jgi:hypothetical protein
MRYYFAGSGKGANEIRETCGCFVSKTTRARVNDAVMGASSHSKKKEVEELQAQGHSAKQNMTFECSICAL